MPALRMLVPISLQSPLSLLNAVRPVVERAQDAVQSPAFRPTAIAAPVSAQGVADTVANAPPIADMNAPTVMTADTGMTVSEVLFWIWLAGAALLCTYMIIVNLGLHRRMLDQISFIGASRGLSVYLARDIASPCLMGVLRPRILLPEDIAQNRNVCDMALRHELAHHRRKDNWWALLRSILLCVYWFNPLVWFAAKLNCEDCEKACDEAVLKGMRSSAREAYGMALIALLRKSARRMEPLISGTTMMSCGKKLMRERIGLIAAERRMRVGRAALAAAMIVFALVITCSSAEMGNGDQAEIHSLETPQPGETAPIIGAERGDGRAPDQTITQHIGDPDTAASLAAADPEDAMAAEAIALYESHLPWASYADVEPSALTDLSRLGEVQNSYAFYGRQSEDGDGYVLGVLTAAESPLREGQRAWDTERDVYCDANGNIVDASVVPSVLNVYGSGEVIFVMTDRQIAEPSLYADNGWLRAALINGEWEIVRDCASRGASLCVPPTPYLRVRFENPYRYHVEYIPLTNEQLMRSYADSRLYTWEEYGSDGLTLMTDETPEYAYNLPIAESLLKLAQERCNYQIGSPADIGSLRAAKLRVERWDGTLIAEQRIDDPEPLAELEALLRGAQPTGGSKSPYTGWLTLEMADGRSLTILKTTDESPLIVFGSSCYYEMSEDENARFWSTFPDVRDAMRYCPR
ncbi:MAG: M56 family metallopeptidase [Clostridiales bacterium]|nr:M56 family metallopeptidase [Clostridiales bacterium]